MKKLLVVLMALLVVAMGFAEPDCQGGPPEDITPPTTAKWYGEPYYTDGVDEWITSDTPISLDAIDEDSGVDYTKYRVWYNGEWTDWLDYTGPFTMGEIGKGKDCLHKIEYYSVDDEGNEESWQEVMVEADAGELEAYSALAVDPFALRTIHIVYTEEGSQSLIYRMSTDFGETWTGKTVLVSGLAEASEPDIEIAPNGDIHIVFVGYLSGQQKRISHIWYDFAANSYSYDNAIDPANWEARVLVDDTGRDNVYPQIATDSLNNVHCVWIGDSDGIEGGAQDIFYSEFDGSSWSPCLTLYPNATTTPGWPNPQIIADDYDDLHVVFLDSNEHMMKYLTYYTEREIVPDDDGSGGNPSGEWGSYHGGAWSLAEADNVGSSSASYGTVAGMAVEGDILHVAWQDVRGGVGQVYENTRNITATDAFGPEWQITSGASIDNDGTSVGEVLMESGKSDNLHLFYRDSVGSDIWYMEYHSAWSIPVKVADSGPDHLHRWSEMAVDSYDGPLLTYTKANNEETTFGIYFKKPYHNQIVRVDNTPPTTTKQVTDMTITLEAKDNCRCEKYAILVTPAKKDHEHRYWNSVNEMEEMLKTKCKETGGWNITKLTGDNATIDNLKKAFEKIKKAADEGRCCQFFFYYCDHGGWDPANPARTEPSQNATPPDGGVGSIDPEDEYWPLKDGKLYDDDFADLIKSICRCKNTVIVIHACYSGGFIPDIVDKNKDKPMVIVTSCAEDESSFSRVCHWGYYNHWLTEGLKKSWSVEKAHEYAKGKLAADPDADHPEPKKYDSDPAENKFLYCCGVGSYEIHYRISYDGEWGPEQVGELNQPVSFKLTEPCEYIIEYWAVDNLGNEEEHHSQSHTVVDHSKCYYIENEVFLGDYVYLEDQFGAIEAMVDWAWFFCNPVEMWHDEVLTPILDPDHHLTLYGLDYEEEPQTWFVTVDNQFGTQELTVYGPIKLGVPTQKVEPGAHEPPLCLDHFLFYEVVEGPSVDVVVGLYDQFHDEPEVLVTRPVFFANPVRKTHGGMVTEIENPEAHLVLYEISGGGIVTEIKNPEAHLVCYEISGGVFETEVQVINQFGEQTFDVSDPLFLAVPSAKLSAEQL